MSFLKPIQFGINFIHCSFHSVRYFLQFRFSRFDGNRASEIYNQNENSNEKTFPFDLYFLTLRVLLVHYHRVVTLSH